MDQTHPRAELDVDDDLAAALIEAQCPEFAGRRLRLVDEGWDNFTYRLGERHALRLPRREVAAGLLLNEQRWLPIIAGWIDVPVPRPVVFGEPFELFPWPWSVVEWIDGDTAEVVALDTATACTMAETLATLHRPAPPHAPKNPFRGVPLSERSEAVVPRLRRLELPRLDHLWAQALEATESTERVWLHGDLHPRNVVVREGRLCGIIDWGDLNGGDKASDLACAWTLFEGPVRAAFLEACPHSPDDRARAVGWAVNFGTALLESGEPRHAAMGADVIRRLLER